MTTHTFDGHFTPQHKVTSDYHYLPFHVPEGVTHIDVQYDFTRTGHASRRAGHENVIDIGLFDPRGHDFNGDGFRGWSGSHRAEFTVGLTDATPGYLPGPIPAGTWHIILGLYKIAPEGCDYSVTVTLSQGTQPTPPHTHASTPPAQQTSAFQAEPGWYRGDLHAHTHHSDAEASVSEIVDVARTRGLDFLAITDHNTVSHLPELPTHGGPDLLLIPGMEVTTYYGHANVWGLSQWLDFRCRDAGAMQRIMKTAHAQGALFGLNHPHSLIGGIWEYGWLEGADIIEVYNTRWLHFNHQALTWWADFDKARALLQEFKGETYLHGLGILPQVGQATAGLGNRAALVYTVFPGADAFVKTIKDSLVAAGVELLGEIEGARPNAPREDLARITAELSELDLDVIVSFGGGSTIDAAKAAEVLRTLGSDIEDYFGTGQVTQALADSGKTLTPHVAIQTASSSAAHLTKYSNITDLETGQKKLIVDEAIVPVQPVFDYEVTFSAPTSLTADGALDGIAHSLEVLYGAVGQPYYAKMEEVAGEGIGLVVKYWADEKRSSGRAQLIPFLFRCAVRVEGSFSLRLNRWPQRLLAPSQNLLRRNGFQSLVNDFSCRRGNHGTDAQ